MYPQKLIDQLSQWKVYKTGMCNGCWSGCCTLPVEVTAKDLVRMELISEDEAVRSLKKIARGLQKQGIIRTFRASTGIFTLEQKHNRDCQFLDEARRCTIYEKRPEVCRNFPTIGPKPGHCPAIARNLVISN